jgi:hypothetical protein
MVVVKILTYPNENVRSYATTKHSGETYKRYSRQLTKKAPQLVKDLLEVDGVVEVGLEPYKISVEKGDAFSWDEIEGEILAVLRKHFGEIEVKGSSPKHPNIYIRI